MDDHSAIHFQDRKAACLAAAKKQAQLLAAVQKEEVLLGFSVWAANKQMYKGAQVFAHIHYILPYFSAKNTALGRKTW